MKKIKPLYIYVSGFIIIIILFVLMQQNNNSTPSTAPVGNMPPSDNIAGKQMPEDSIHKGLQNPLAQTPGKNNVMPSIKQHMDELKKAVDEHPRDTLKIREYADFLSDAHMDDQALSNYQKILKVNPRRIDVLSSMVYLYFDKNDLVNAKNVLNKILSIDRNNLDAIYNLGAVSANMGDKAKARQLWTRIINEFPKSQLAQKAKDSIAQL